MPITYTIEVTPSPVAIPQGQTQQFVATKIGSDGSRTTPNVIWTTDGGTISDTGLLTPDPDDFIGSSGYPTIVDGEIVYVMYTVTATENDSG